MPNELLDKYRAKYPKYKDVDDATLAKGIVEKFPVYADRLQDVLAPPQHTFGSEQITTKEAPDPILDARVAAVEATGEATGQFGKGIGQMFGGGQPVAGLLNAGAGLLKVPAPAFAATRELLRPTPLNPIIEGAEGVLGAVGDFVGNTFGEGSRQVASTLGASPETAQAISEPMRDIGSLTGQGLVLGGVGKVGGGLRPSRLGATMERGFETMGTRALQAGEDLATRQTATRRALSDPNYQITPKGSDFAKSRAQTLQGEKMSGLVEPATQRGDMYSVQPVRNKFKGLIDEFEKSGGRNNADVLAVKKVVAKFEEIVKREGFDGEFLSPQRLEIFKEDLNVILSKDFQATKRGQPSELQPIKKQALRAEVSGAKSILEENLPGIKELNKAQSTEIVINQAIDDVLFKMSGGMRTPTGLTASLRGDPAGIAALTISEKIFKPNIRFDIAGKGYRAGRKLQGKPVGGPTVPPYDKIPLHDPVPTTRQLAPPAIQMGDGGTSTLNIRTGPVSAVPDVSSTKPKQLERGPVRLREEGPTEKLGERIEDLQWNAKKQIYESKPKKKK